MLCPQYLTDAITKKNMTITQWCVLAACLMPILTMGAAKAGANEVLTEECTIVCEELIRVK